jgi:hypothetical protein
MDTPFPIIRAIEAIMGLPTDRGSLGLQGGLYENEKEPRIFLADYRRFLPDASPESAFSNLWGVATGCGAAAGSGAIKALSGACSIVLVEVDHYDDETYASEPRLPQYLRHLRATDWALAFYTALVKSLEAAGATATRAVPRVFILDLTDPSQVTDRSGFDASGLGGLLQVFRIGSDIRGLDAFAKSIRENAPSVFSPPVGFSQTLKRLARQWIASLADAGDAADTIGRSHYLNNLLGPLALAVEMDGRSGGTSLREMVSTSAKSDGILDLAGRRALMRAIEWTSRTFSGSEPAQQSRMFSRAGRRLRVLVLDDQIEDGWLPVLAHVVGVDLDGTELSENFSQIGTSPDGHVSLWASTSPKATKEALRRVSDFHQGFPKALRFSAREEDGVEPEFDEILLLDLRLFATEEDSTSERDFETWVSNALDEDWSLKGPHDARRLTGLARLIAERDYSYPIIVWSSTKRREILEQLRSYGNIHTALRKPTFDAYGSGAEDFVSDFHAALTVAQRMNDARRWLWLTLAKHQIQQAGNTLYRRIRQQVGSHTHTFLYLHIDESNESHDVDFKHGGIAVILSTNSNPEAADSKPLQDAMRGRLSTALGHSTVNFGGLKLRLTDLDKSKFSAGNAAFSNSMTYLESVIAAVEGCGENDTSAMCVPMATLAHVSGISPKIDARHLNAINSLVLTCIAAVSHKQKKLFLHLEFDGRIKPIGTDACSKAEWSSWFTAENIAEINSIAANVASGKKVSTMWREQGVQFPPSTTPLFIRKGDSGRGIDIMYSAVTPPVVHTLASFALNAASKKFPGLSLIGATTMDTHKPSPHVQNTVADFVPRWLIRTNAATGKSFVSELCPTGTCFFDISDQASSGTASLLDIFFQHEAPDAGMLIKLRGVLGQWPEEKAVNSFESILLARIADSSLKNIRGDHFWTFARGLDLLRV